MAEKASFEPSNNLDTEVRTQKVVRTNVRTIVIRRSGDAYSINYRDRSGTEVEALSEIDDVDDARRVALELVGQKGGTIVDLTGFVDANDTPTDDRS